MHGMLILVLTIVLTSCATFEGRPEQPQKQALLRNPAQRPRVTMGMSTREVISVLGEPRNVQVAGDGSEGHERWIYPMGSWNEMDGKRVLYFEHGRLSGWESTYE